MSRNPACTVPGGAPLFTGCVSVSQVILYASPVEATLSFSAVEMSLIRFLQRQKTVFTPVFLLRVKMWVKVKALITLIFSPFYLLCYGL